jgi:hypothetical protein
MTSIDMLPITPDKTIYLGIWWWEGEAIVIRGYDSKQRVHEDKCEVEHLYFDETLYPYIGDNMNLEIPHTEILEFIDEHIKLFCGVARYQIVELELLGKEVM